MAARDDDLIERLISVKEANHGLRSRAAEMQKILGFSRCRYQGMALAVPQDYGMIVGFSPWISCQGLIATRCSRLRKR
jgi:hypothetical protein